MGGYESFQLFKKCKVYKNKLDKNEWWIDIDAHNQSLGLLFDFKTNYFKYRLWNVLRLKSANQLRMYELIKQYETIGSRTITIKDLREYLNINSAEYPRWERFRTKVLDACQKALEESTDIKFTYETIKRGKGGKVVEVRFYIEKNKTYKTSIIFEEFESFPEVFSNDNLLLLESKDQLMLQDRNDECGDDIAEENEFINDTLASFADACNHEFNEEQMQVIYNILIKIIPYAKTNCFMERFDFLKYHYDNMCSRDKDPSLGKIKIVSSILKQFWKMNVGIK